jgi:alkanesulfonate monooxygenase SsuD/methylene tetrahydromethanopterin reductase-like flavin-dependent oxidoreductase (luciferase family)
MPVRFGATVVQIVPYPEVRSDFAFAEATGLDNAWLIDQFGIDGLPEVPLLEAWTSLAALGAHTDTIRIGTLVTNVAMRNPGVLAQSMLTIDQISGGRLEVAVGGGFYPAEHRALGIDFLDPRGRGDRLREAVAILDGALRGKTLSHDGVHFRLAQATFRPQPTQLPRPPLWVAAQATRSLRVAVAHADGVVSLGEENEGMDVSLPAYRGRMERIDELCVAAGRDPATLRRCYFAGWADEPFFASPDAAVDMIGRYAEAGATDFSFYLHNPASSLLDELLAAHRAGTRVQFEEMAAEVFPLFGD